jgi:hypothetical protein
MRADIQDRIVICWACGDRRLAGAERRHCACGRSSWRTARDGTLVLVGPSVAYGRDDTSGAWVEIDGRSPVIVRPSLVA